MSDTQTLPFTCPICGRKTDHPVADLKEGAELTCPFCKLKLILHGHMWGEVRGELEKMGIKPHVSGSKSAGGGSKVRGPKNRDR